MASAAANQGAMLLNMGLMGDAIAAFQKGTEEDPKDVACWVGLVRANLSQGEVPAVRDALRQVLTLQPENLEAQSHWLMLDFYDGDESAVEKMKQVAGAPQAQYFEHFNLARVLTAQGDLEGAQAEYQHLERLAPEDIFIQYELGRIALQREDFEAASRHLTRVLSNQPQDAMPYVMMSRAKVGLGDVDGAVAMITKARQYGPQLPAVLEQLFSIHLLAGEIYSALQDAYELRLLDEENPDYMYKQGICLLMLGRYDQALEVLAPAHELAPGSSDLVRALARSREGLGDKQAAMTLLEEFTREFGEDASVAIDLSRLYFSQPGGPEKARRLLESVVKADPDNEEAQLNYALALSATGAPASTALPHAERAAQSDDPEVQEEAAKLVEELKKGGKARQVQQ